MSDGFATSVKAWVADNLPEALKGVDIGMYGPSSLEPEILEAFELWRRRLAEQGWGAPTWPEEYGGAGLAGAEAKIIAREIHAAGSMNPIPFLAGMGVTMVGPTLMEYGTEEQKTRHLPGMASGAVRWCLGLSEPNAGSDLASLATRAVQEGDHWILNGQKTWTSLARSIRYLATISHRSPMAA